MYQFTRAQVLVRLRSIVADVVGSSDVGDDEPLMAAGLDSLAVVELRGRVEAAFGVALPATVALDYPTLKVREEVESSLKTMQLLL